jgi:inosose dehydratase
MRIAAAPITWGVCETPEWGVQLEPDRVLAEMRRAGFFATELGPDGWLGDTPEVISTMVSSFGLALVGGFVPAVLHVDDVRARELENVRRQAERLASAGADVLVLAAVRDSSGYEESTEANAQVLATLCAGIADVEAVVSQAGLTVALHPHVGTIVERAAAVEYVAGHSDIGLCLDTGHLLVGGVDPAAFVRAHVDRIVHVHLKDVDAAVASQVRDGDLGYADAVGNGMYVPLGSGDAGIQAIVDMLESSGYDGWYVLEQDVRLEGENVDPAADAANSLEMVLRMAGNVPAESAG